MACIGPAGEKQVRYAAIMVDGKDGRAIGRAGLGAVMGSKNLKAVAVRGTQNFAIADEPGLNGYLKDLRKEIVSASKGFGATLIKIKLPSPSAGGATPSKTTASYDRRLTASRPPARAT